MADGLYRFQQPGVGQFSFQTSLVQNTSFQSALLRNYTGSPHRAKLSSDSPTPSRSPHLPPDSVSKTYNMYSQGHQAQHAAMLNGSQAHQRFAMQMPKFQHQNHHPHHAQQHHHTHHNQAAHQLNHQPNFPGGTLASTTPHFTPSHMQNGTPGTVEDEIDDSMNEHWQQQLQLATEARQATSPHYYARTIAQQTKGIQIASGQSEVTDSSNDNRPSTTTSKDSKRQGWTALDFTSQGLRAISTALFNYRFLNKLYLSNNKLKSLPSAIGQLRSLTHLDLSANELTELPVEIGMLTNLRTLYVFDNHIRSLPHELGYLYRLEMLGIYGNPLNDVLLSQIKTHGTKALIKYLIEEMPVHLPPSDRDWIVLDETSKSSQASADKFTVLSYNTLCDQSATPSHYGYVPSRALAWEFRRDLILNEIRSHDADIACLQEIDQGNYNDFFREQLAYNDYKGVYWPRGRAMGMHEEEAKVVDGCATFFKASKYILLDKQMINFGQTAVRRPDAKGQDDIYNRLWQKDHIAVVVFLENRMTGTRLIVVNAHLYWDPAFKDVKLIQTAIMMEELTRLADKYSKLPPCADKTAFRFSEAEDGARENITPVEPAPSAEYSSGDQIPLLICGDFNSAPGEAAYNLLAHGGLTEAHPDLEKRLYGNLSRLGMTHPFKLKSAYSAIGELSFTNYTPDFNSILDYIWFSSTALHVTGLLGEVDKEYLQRVPGFPNYHFPSDHLALLAEFSVKGKKGKVIEADFGPSRDRSN